MTCGGCEAKFKTFAEYREHKAACAVQGQWQRHFEAVNEGKHGTARRLERKIFGTVGPPMSEEAKARLASPEYKERAKIRAAERRIQKRANKIVASSMIRRKR